MKSKATLRAGSAIAGSLHFLVSAVLILGISYALGHALLEHPLQGGDRPLHVGYIAWLNSYFPDIPHWFPLQGGGLSLLHGYPVFSYYLVIALHKISGLSLLQSGSLVGFAVFPIAALGIYMFCWSALKSKTVGIIAAIFYLMSPITWTWIHDWGFFPYSVAMAFLPFTLILFDQYQSLVLRDPRSARRRIWLVALVLSIALAGLIHPTAGASGIAAIFLYSLFSALTAKPGEREYILRHGLKAVLWIGIIVLLLLSFYIIPFYRYGQISNREGLNLISLSQIPHIPKSEFFGLSPIDPKIIHTRMSNPLVVTLLLVIGLVLSVRLSRKALSLTLIAVFAAIYSLFPEFSYSLGTVSSSLRLLFGLRSTIGLIMVLFPIGAAYGAWALARGVISPTIIFRRRKSDREQANKSRFGIRGFFASSLAVIIAVIGALAIGPLHSTYPKTVSYGPSPNGVVLPNISEVRAFIDGCSGSDEIGDGQGTCSPPDEGLIERLVSEFLPPIQITDTDWLVENTEKVASLLPDEGKPRVDMSPYLGYLAQYFTAFSDTSQIPAYAHTLSLIHAMWGYQLNVFYFPEIGTADALNDMADWMGIQYVFLEPSRDSSEKLEAAGWQLIVNEEGPLIYEYPQAPELATAIIRPTILVIGGQDNGSYFQLFRLANQGLAPYSEFIIVEGTDRIDDYSLDELRRFDILFLHGYEHRNRDKAWDMLNDYVRQGGSIFIDTGWQFEIPEWEFDQTPEVLPINRLDWTNSGHTREYTIENIEIAGEIDTKQFDPMVWENEPWSFSSANRDQLREWSRPILSVENYPIVAAGELGQGRVIWSGMNLPAHLIAYDNEEEKRLLHNLLGWLGRGPEEVRSLPVQVTRNHPDRVDFSFAGQAGDVTWLYWREAFYPNWHAYVIDGEDNLEIPIYRGGPGFMLMPIESAAKSVSVVLMWEPSMTEKLGVLLSMFGILLLGALVVDGLLLSGNGFTWAKIFIAMRIPSPFLGDGSSAEWAERKRAEIEEGSTDPRPLTLEPSKAIPWMRGEHSDGNAKPPGATADDSSGLELHIQDPANEDDLALLESWLNNSSHGDDVWAEKLLGRGSPDNEPEANK